jgi:epoxyqueuosine reductase
MIATAGAGLVERLKAQAYGLGFDLAGVTTLGPAETAVHLRDWLARGQHGEMTYLDRGAALRADTTLPEPGMRSAIVVARDYGGRQPSGPIARYARGDDYHEVMRTQLRDLHRWLEQVRRHRSDSRARPRAARRPRLVWQEHHADQSRQGIVLFSRRIVRGARP